LRASALFDAIAGGFRATAQRKLIRLPHNVNDLPFAEALVAAFRDVTATPASLPDSRRERAAAR